MVQTQKSANSGKSDIKRTWTDLKLAWKTFKIAKMNEDKNEMSKSAERIRVLQHELGSKKSQFPELEKN